MAFGCRTKVPKSALAHSQYHVVCKHSCCGTVVLTGDDMKTATVNPLAGRATFLSPTVYGRSDNIVVFP